MSYSKFAFSNLKIEAGRASDTQKVDVSFDVKNSGLREAAEVAELYVGDPSAQIERPVEELKGIKKVRLKAGETQRVTLELDRRSFAYWDVRLKGWRVDPGNFTIMVGDSSENLPLNGTMILP